MRKSKIDILLIVDILMNSTLIIQHEINLQRKFLECLKLIGESVTNVLGWKGSRYMSLVTVEIFVVLISASFLRFFATSMHLLLLN